MGVYTDSVFIFCIGEAKDSNSAIEINTVELMRYVVNFLLESNLSKERLENPTCCTAFLIVTSRFSSIMQPDS
jgi:hypothetical protein